MKCVARSRICRDISFAVMYVYQPAMNTKFSKITELNDYPICKAQDR